MHKLQTQSEIINPESKLLDALDNYVRAVRFKADEPIKKILRDEIRQIKKKLKQLKED